MNAISSLVTQIKTNKKEWLIFLKKIFGISLVILVGWFLPSFTDTLEFKDLLVPMTLVSISIWTLGEWKKEIVYKRNYEIIKEAFDTVVDFKIKFGYIRPVFTYDHEPSDEELKQIGTNRKYYNGCDDTEKRIIRRKIFYDNLYREHKIDETIEKMKRNTSYVLDEEIIRKDYSKLRDEDERIRKILGYCRVVMQKHVKEEEEKVYYDIDKKTLEMTPISRENFEKMSEEEQQEILDKEDSALLNSCKHDIDYANNPKEVEKLLFVDKEITKSFIEIQKILKTKLKTFW